MEKIAVQVAAALLLFWFVASCVACSTTLRRTPARGYPPPCECCGGEVEDEHMDFCP